jgi:hypothetical protein
VLSDFPKQHLPLVADNAPAGLKDYWKRIPKLVETNLDPSAQGSRILREWRHLSAEIRRLGPAPEDIPGLLDAVDQLVVEAQAAGVLGGTESASEWDRFRNANGIEWYRTLAKILEGLDAFGEQPFWRRLQFIATDYGPDLVAAANVLEACLAIFDRTTSNLNLQQKRSRKDSGVQDLMAVIAKNFKEATYLLKELR